MEPEDIEQLLANAKYKHLSEETLVSYRDSKLDKIRMALADAHLRLCLICQQRLEEKQDELELNAMSEASLAAIQRSIDKVKAESETPSSISIKIQRLRSYIRELLDAWMFVFAQEATLGSEDEDEIWRYESEDGFVTAWARLNQEDASLEVYFSSPDLALEGTRIRFRLGPFQTEVTLLRDDDSKVEVVAKIKIPLEERASEMTDLSIEIV